MKPRYPKILPWLAKKAGIPVERAEALWVEALGDATRKSARVESPEYWRVAEARLLERIAAESLARRAAPFGWGSLMRLPARQWLHGLTTAEALLAIGVRTASSFRQRRCC